MTVRLEVPSRFVLNANRPVHYRARAPIVKTLRLLGKRAAEGRTFPVPCLLVAHIGFPDKRRRDLHNYYPTLKAVIDGVVDAGALIDDDHKHLIGPDLRLETTKSRKGFISLRLEPQEMELSHGEDS